MEKRAGLVRKELQLNGNFCSGLADKPLFVHQVQCAPSSLDVTLRFLLAEVESSCCRPQVVFQVTVTVGQELPAVCRSVGWFERQRGKWGSPPNRRSRRR